MPCEGTTVSNDTTDILCRLDDLHKQATTERSHFYVASIAKDAAKEIRDLRIGKTTFGGPTDGWETRSAADALVLAVEDNKRLRAVLYEVRKFVQWPATAVAEKRTLAMIDSALNGDAK